MSTVSEIVSQRGLENIISNEDLKLIGDQKISEKFLDDYCRDSNGDFGKGFAEELFKAIARHKNDQKNNHTKSCREIAKEIGSKNMAPYFAIMGITIYLIGLLTFLATGDPEAIIHASIYTAGCGIEAISYF